MSLEQRMKDVLAEASVVAEAKAAAMSSPTSHGKPGSSILSSEGPALYDRLWRRFSAAQTVREREEAVAWAEGQVRAAKRQEPRELTAQQEEYWILVEAQGRDYRDVAAEFGKRAETVWKMRSDAGFEPRKGRPKAA